MNTKQFMELREELRKEAEGVLAVKGYDYPTNDDRLSNFKSIADICNIVLGRTDITPGLVWFIYMMKHIIPFSKWVVDGKRLESEPIMSRAVDLENYNFLGYALGSEQETAFANQIVEEELRDTAIAVALAAEVDKRERNA